MSLELFQLNAWKGRYLKETIQFVKENGFDICHFQEVSGGEASYNKQDDFEELKRKLGYHGEIVKTAAPESKAGTFFGNATFLKPGIKVLGKEVVWLKDFDPNFEVGSKEFNPQSSSELASFKTRFRSEEASRAALILFLETQERRFYSVNTHLAWGKSPKDELYKIEQAKKLIDVISKFDYPYILSGDFNMVSGTEVLNMFEKLGRNLTRENNIKFTLNPETHYLGRKAVEENLAVDFIFVSRNTTILNEVHKTNSPEFILTHPSISVGEFSVVEKTLSDHKGLILRFGI